MSLRNRVSRRRIELKRRQLSSFCCPASSAVDDLLACVFEVAEHTPDSMGIALTPITYR